MEWIESLAAKKHGEACKKAGKSLRTLDALMKKMRHTEELAGQDALKFTVPSKEIEFLLGCAPKLGGMDYFEVLKAEQKASAFNSSLPGEFAKQLTNAIGDRKARLEKIATGILGVKEAHQAHMQALVDDSWRMKRRAETESVAHLSEPKKIELNGIGLLFCCIVMVPAGCMSFGGLGAAFGRPGSLAAPGMGLLGSIIGPLFGPVILVAIVNLLRKVAYRRDIEVAKARVAPTIARIKRELEEALKQAPDSFANDLVVMKAREAEAARLLAAVESTRKMFPA